MPKFVKGQPRPANAGRKKGTQNRATIERNKAKDEAMNAEANESPRDYMLRIMAPPVPTQLGVMQWLEPAPRTCTHSCRQWRINRPRDLAGRRRPPVAGHHSGRGR